jgi:predicted DsbA family dithiol-disulfide isomerase
MTDSMTRLLSINVFFDLICPWSWIGTRNLEAALREFLQLHPAIEPAVHWRAHPLLPDTPLAGASYQSFYLSRSGGPTSAALRREQIQHAGHAAGVTFDFKRISVLPNTTAAHGLIGCMTAHGTTTETFVLVDRLFKAFFAEGADIGDLQVLERLGLECGVKPQTLLACLDDLRNRPPATRKPTRRGRPMKGEILATPHFVFNGTETVSGARSVDALLSSMQRAVDESA